YCVYSDCMTYLFISLPFNFFFFFFSSRRRHTRSKRDWSSDVCSSDLMMKDVHQLSTAEIGSVIIFPGTMSVIIFGYIGGILVDRRGPLYVLNIGVTFLSVSFLTASFLLETTSWFMTIIIVFVL